MKWNILLISIALQLCTLPAMANDNESPQHRNGSRTRTERLREARATHDQQMGIADTHTHGDTECGQYGHCIGRFRMELRQAPPVGMRPDAGLHTHARLEPRQAYINHKSQLHAVGNNSEPEWQLEQKGPLEL